jgi:hypothetical protein
MSQGRAARLEQTTPRPDAPWPCYAPRRCPMPSRYRFALVLCCGLLSLLGYVAPAADVTTARVAVYFSPHEGATAALAPEVNAATHQSLVQAYSLTLALLHKPSEMPRSAT